MKHRSLHDGAADGLEPLKSLSLDEVESWADCDEVRRIVEFCRNPGPRGIIRGRPRKVMQVEADKDLF